MDDFTEEITKPTTILFYGHSDDCFCVDVRGTKEEIYADQSYQISEKDRPRRGLVITGVYAPANASVWMIGLSPVEEDAHIPDWPMRWSMAPNGYSIQLEIKVPAGCVVNVINKQN